MGGDQVRFDAPLPDLWDDEHAASLDEPGLLLYRSNLLGSDLRITNFGGGNTSAKMAATDPLTGAPTEVLWVKGSGGDIGSMKLDGFSTLYLDKLLSLKSIYRGLEHEDEMVALYDHCTFNLNPRAASIDTPLHGFVPHRACRPRSRGRGHRDRGERERRGADAARSTAARSAFCRGSGRASTSACKLGAMAEANPNLKGVVLGGHGLFTWGPTSKDCYEITLEMINKAARWLERERPQAQPSAGRASRRCRGRTGAMSPRSSCPPFAGVFRASERKIGHFTDAPAVLEFVNSRDLKPLAALGTSCPDHFLRTKIRPLVLPSTRRRATSTR